MLSHDELNATRQRLADFDVRIWDMVSLHRHIDAQAARLATLVAAGDALAKQAPALMGAIHDGHDQGYLYVNDAMFRAHEALNAWRAAREGGR